MPDYWLLPYLGQTVTTIHPNKRNKNKKDNNDKQNINL
jgi:hypothetical protein